VRFFSRAGPSPPGTKENPRQTGGKAASEVDDSLGFLLAALSGLLLLLTRLLAAATLLTTLLLSRLLLPAAALLATLTALLAALAALLTTLARILICHDVYVSFLGKFPQLDNPACASTFRTVAHILSIGAFKHGSVTMELLYAAACGIRAVRRCAENILALRVSRIGKGSGAVEKPGDGFAKFGGVGWLC
jgi:hypothetical protein